MDMWDQTENAWRRSDLLVPRVLVGCVLVGCVLVGCLVAPAVHAQADMFRVGAAMRSITPDPLLPLSGGMGPTTPARERQGDLTARAVVVERDGVRVAIVSIDLLGFPRVLGDRVRERITGVPADQVLIGATHTHSAPDCYAFPDGQGGHTGDLDYLDWVCSQTATAINEATARLTPAKLRVGTGEVRPGIAYNYYAPDLYDRQVGVLQMCDGNEHVLATLVNFAVHPEVLGAQQGICSPDLVGPLCDKIEREMGGMALFMNGAQGGMITADNRDLSKPSDARRGYWEDRRTWDECLRIGEALADDAIACVRSLDWDTSPELTCVSKEVAFPVASDTMWAVVENSPLNYPRGNRHVSTQLNALQLGSARILTIPGEALPNVGLYLKRKMGGEHHFLFGLTNDAFGYILAEVDFQSFARYDYVSRVSLGEQTGEILMTESLALVKQLEAP